MKNEIKNLIEHFKKDNAWKKSEEHIQSYYTRELLRIIGYDNYNIQINDTQEVKTGKRNSYMLYISCKKCYFKKIFKNDIQYMKKNICRKFLGKNDINKIFFIYFWKKLKNK